LIAEETRSAGVSVEENHSTQMRQTPKRWVSREMLYAAVAALLILIPCFWQPYIAAGDLASHSYNAWLTNEIKAGRTPGLMLASPLTNVLTDLVLAPLSQWLGRSWSERIVVSIVVQTFFWGVFFFITTVRNGSRPWTLAPFIAMLSYGLIFQFGFLNFYAATAASVWVLALLWHPTAKKIAAAIPMAAVAVMGHALPLAWAVGALVYVHVVRRAPDHERKYLFLAGGALLVLGRAIATAIFPYIWQADQVFSFEGLLGLGGLEQYFLYGAKYLIPIMACAFVWALLLAARVERGSLLADPVAHLWLLTTIGLVILPQGIKFRPDMFFLLYIPQRISLFAAILFLALIAGAASWKWLAPASVLIAASFFTMLYLDARAIQQVERQLVRLFDQLPRGQRVAAILRDRNSPRMNGVVHVGSGACIGRCFDFANYEPATGQFRVRAVAPNAFNANAMATVQEFETGRHVLTAAEAPLYSICTGGPGEPLLVIRLLSPGDKVCLSEIPVTPQFGSGIR
jgi:hypothetical protein